MPSSKRRSTPSNMRREQGNRSQALWLLKRNWHHWARVRARAWQELQKQQEQQEQQQQQQQREQMYTLLLRRQQ